MSDRLRLAIAFFAGMFVGYCMLAFLLEADYGLEVQHIVTESCEDGPEIPSEDRTHARGEN